ncbi:MAG: carbohydrate-binding module family 20 domain-containing protein [Balneolaceae bacterium]
MNNLIKNNTSLTQKVFLLALFMASSTLLIAQPVTFSVQIPNGVVKTGDVVEVRGELDQLGAWDNTGPRLAKQESSDIWTTSVAIPGKVSKMEFKYVIVRASGKVEWESGHDRSLQLTSAGNRSTPTTKFRGYEKEMLAENVTVTLSLTTNDMFVNGYKPEQIALLGNRGALGWDLETEKLLFTETSENLWQISFQLAQYSPVDVEFKLAWEAEGVWHWEYLAGHANHLLLIDPSTIAVDVQLVYNPESGRIETSRSTGTSVDAYQQAMTEYGDARRFRYFYALQLLEAGDLPKARQVYTEHRKNYTPVNVDDIDDFDFLWAHALAEQGRIADALSFTEQKAAEDTVGWRRSYFHYLKGELLLNEGRFEEARAPFQQALEFTKQGDQDQMVEGYAHQGLAISYMRDPDPEMKRRARGHLFTLAMQHPDEQTKRMAYRNLLDVSTELNDQRSIDRAMKGLTEHGSEKQKNRSRIAGIERRMEYMEPDSVAYAIQQLENRIQDEELANEVQLLKAEHLIKSGKKTEALIILNQLEAREKESPAKERAKMRKQMLMKNEQKAEGRQ